jgi:hypothetical protein
VARGERDGEFSDTRHGPNEQTAKAAEGECIVRTPLAKLIRKKKAAAQSSVRDSLVYVPLGMVLDIRRLQARMSEYAARLSRQKPCKITRDAKRTGRMEAFATAADKLRKILSENRVYR